MAAELALLAGLMGAVQVEKKPQRVLIALDTSGSMAGSRLSAAKGGIETIISKLGEKDHVGVLTFNSDVSVLTGDGYIQTLAHNKEVLKRQLAGVRARDQTKLYDAIKTSLNVVLSKAAEARAVEQVAQLVQQSVDLGNFWLVVLTDGEDTRSKATLDVTSDLQRVHRELGQLGLCKIVFIGVNLKGSAERKLQQLAEAGGSSAEYFNCSNVSEIAAKFEEIAVKIDQRFIESVREAITDDEPWSGIIQKGSHVRAINSKYGWAKVRRGDVGVVKSRDGDGNFKVCFPEQDNWTACPADIQLDAMAERIRPGARVRVKPGVTPRRGWGRANASDVGYVKEVKYDGNVVVELGFPKGLWHSIVQELEIVTDPSFGGHPGILKAGNMVRIPASTAIPNREGNRPTHSSIGFLKGGDVEGKYLVDFPEVDNWVGHDADLEIAAEFNNIRPGVRVKVSRSVNTPRFGWGNVNHASIGVVMSIKYDCSVVECRFPENRSWKCKVQELEMVSASDLEGKMFCLNRHSLCRFQTPHGRFKCDHCKEDQPERCHMFGCRQCDFDVCEVCMGLEPPRTAPREASAEHVAAPAAAPVGAAASMPSGTPVAQAVSDHKIPVATSVAVPASADAVPTVAAATEIPLLELMNKIKDGLGIEKSTALQAAIAQAADALEIRRDVDQATGAKAKVSVRT